MAELVVPSAALWVGVFNGEGQNAGLLLRGERIGQHSTRRSRDDVGWYAFFGYRVLPGLQLLAKQEDFQRPAVGLARRVSATTFGANVELPGGRTRLLANVVTRRTGWPRVRRNALIAQVQVRF